MVPAGTGNLGNLGNFAGGRMGLWVTVRLGLGNKGKPGEVGRMFGG